MKKHERLELLRKIILENEIETQHDLVAKLEAHGLKSTQATISRDINNLGIIKIPGKSGKYVYGLSKESARKLMTPLQQSCESIVSLSEPTTGLEQMLSISVIPGNTRLLKRLLLQEYQDQIFSILADDDSILVILKTTAFAKELRYLLAAWIKQHH
ncbi:arginine repressor [Streptococcus dentapri]|uniref:Arginine repressor n=1 Tax=Streptococcus dentapri TaxID=573564 RepID=A0ABV8D128_9STRE